MAELVRQVVVSRRGGPAVLLRAEAAAAHPPLGAAEVTGKIVLRTSREAP